MFSILYYRRIAQPTAQTCENFGRGVGGTLRGVKTGICADNNHHHHVNACARERSLTPPPSLPGLYKRRQSASREHGRSSTAQVYLTIMKAVALILALAVITGCNARAVRQADASPVLWEDTVDRFWQSISDLTQKADGVLEDLKASQLSRELDTLITDTMAELSTYRDDIQTKLGPYTDAGQLTQDLQLLFQRLQKDMVDAKDRSTEYLSELKSMMEQNSDDVRARINTYTRKLKKRLNTDTEEIRNTVATYLGEFQSRSSQNLETAKEHIVPYVQQASDTATKKLSDISSQLRVQAEGLGKQLETQAEGIRTQLEATAQDLRTSLEGKIDELTVLLAPIATQLREKFEGIVDQVKETTTS